jgi:hypothetical protein
VPAGRQPDLQSSIEPGAGAARLDRGNQSRGSVRVADPSGCRGGGWSSRNRRAKQHQQKKGGQPLPAIHRDRLPIGVETGRAHVKAASGTTIHCNSGDSPVPSGGTRGIAGA